MTLIETVYWTVSAMCVIVRLVGGNDLSSNMIMAIWVIVGVLLIICWEITCAKAALYPLLYTVFGIEKMSCWGKDIDVILHEIESGRLDVSPERLKYIKSAKRIASYGTIPVAIIIISNWLLS